MPRFSVIVGIYNQGEMLPALIDSLKKQTFRDFDVHFCDDGSNDINPEKLIASMDVNFPWRYHMQEHKGMRLAKNLNQGIAAARGEYCVLVMADSMMEFDYLELLDRYVEPNRIVCGMRVQVDMIGGEMVGVDIDWRMKKNLVPQFPTVVIEQPWLCLTGNGLTIPTQAFREHGPLLEELEGYGGEDTEIVARLYYKGFLCWSVPDLRLYHRWHKAQKTGSHTIDKVGGIIQRYGN